MIQDHATDHSVRVKAILQFVHEELLNREGQTTLSATDDLLSSGAVDSLGVMRLVAFVESEFCVRIAPEAVTMENFLNGQAIAELVHSLTKAEQ